jgi:radical SAM superfamily enzyme YgiQ (UPF0313 family)
MREPGAILLVACYELGHQPLAVAWPAAFLEGQGYAPAVLDVSVEPLDPDRVRHARLVAISVPMHTALRLGVAVAQRVRTLNPTCHIAFYGLYASLNADHLLTHVADSIFGGEVEEALVRLAQHLEREPGRGQGQPGWGSQDPFPATAEERQPARWSPAAHGLASADGVVLRPPARPPLTPPGAALEKLDFPVPSRTKLAPLKKYAHLERDGRRELAGYVEASRGCKHRCRHCPIPPVYGGRFFVVPRQVVQADIRQLVDAGATHITFGDPDFLNGPRHALEVARALHAEFPRVTFDFTAKVEHLLRQRAHLAELAALGCLFIVTAVESLSDTVLTHLAKGHTRTDVEGVLRLARGAGIALRPTWVPFTPWTTLDDYREMLDFIARERLVDHVDPVQYSIRLLVPPGSLLLEATAFQPFLGPLVEDAFHYRWTHPDPRMDALQAEVAQLVEKAAAAREDGAMTFTRIAALADTVAGLAPRPPDPAPAARRLAPRLTEAWFC